MTVLDGVIAGSLVFLAIAALILVFVLRAVWRSLTWLTESVARIGELLREMLGPLGRMSEQGAPDALLTRINAVETGLESQKMLVSDAVERVTALGNRVAARQRRQAATFDEDEEPDTSPTPEQVRALSALLGKGNGQAPISPAEPASGLSLKERAKLHRAQRGGGNA